MVVSIIGNYCCTRVVLYAKMLNETENEETSLYCHIFIIGGILIRGGGWLPLATPMIVASMLFVVILRAFLLVCLSM